MLVEEVSWLSLELSESRVVGCPAGCRRRQDGRHGEHREDRDGFANFRPGAAAAAAAATATATATAAVAAAGHRRRQLYDDEREHPRDEPTNAECGSLGNILGDGSSYARYPDDGTRTLLCRLSFLSGS